MTKDEHSRLWRVINEYVIVCGGIPPHDPASAKETAVQIVQIDQVVNRIENRVEEDFAARCLTLDTFHVR